MVRRRAVLATGAAVGVASLAGCLDFVTGSEALELEAQRGTPSDATLSESGYGEHELGWEEFEEEVSFAGIEREIHARIWTAAYTGEVPIAGENVEAAVFAVLTVPSTEVLGRTLNPLDAMDDVEMIKEFAEDFEGEGDGLEEIEHVETRETEILGEERDVEVFEAVTYHDGLRVELYLDVAIVDNAGDLVVVLGGFPQVVPEERENTDALMASVEHPEE